MKNKLIILNILFIVSFGSFTIWKGLDTPKIAYVRSSALIAKYEGFIQATQTFRERSVVWEANIDTLKTELQQEIQSFEKAKARMTKKEIELSKELIATKQKQLRQYQDGVMQKAQTQDQEMTTKVMEEINAFIKEYGSKHNYTIIHGATEVGNIIYSNETVDITEEILTELNQHYNTRIN